MTRGAWIVVLVAAGIGAAVVLGLLATRDGGESQADAQQSFCSSLSTLEASVGDLTALDPSSASKEDYQSAVDEIQSDWDDVASDASDLTDITTSDLDSAWDTFDSTLKGVPDDASVSDALDSVTSAAQTFATTVQSTLSGPDCSST